MSEEIKNDKEQEETKELRLERPLDKMTAPELRDIAKEIPGVTGVHAMKKEELIRIIKEAKGIKDEKVTKGKIEKAMIKGLKKKIKMLKVQKEEARKDRDREKIKILRRRINRLKKRTRKLAKGI